MTFSSSDPKCTGNMLLRVFFGLSLFFIGVTHYLQFQSFQLMVTDGLNYLTVLGTIWSFILPALLIAGGGLFVTGRFNGLATWLSGIALGSIVAGSLFKPLLSGIGLEEMMPAATQTLIWLTVFVLVAKGCCCNGCTPDGKPMKK